MKKLSLLIFLLAFFIYGYRIWNINRPIHAFSPGHMGTQELNPEFFQRYIGDPHSQVLRKSLTTLIVVVVPDYVCPPLLGEAPHWSAPKDSYPNDVFNTLILAPNTTEDYSIETMMASFSLAPDQFRFFEDRHPIWALARSGVLKILYSREQGVVWWEKGSEHHDAHLVFEQRLRTSIEDLL